MAAKARAAEEGARIPWRPVGLALVGALFVAFWHNPLLWPAKVLVVLFHELSHAIACWLTGGSVDAIGLMGNQGGITAFHGGMPFVVANAGYLGSLVWGIGLLWAGKQPWSNRAVGGLAVVLGVTALLFVRPLVSFGFGFALLAAAALLVAGRWGGRTVSGPLLDGLGVFSVLYALFDIRDDVFLGTGFTDASALAQMTYIPAVVWGLAWLAAGGVALWATRRWWA